MTLIRAATVADAEALASLSGQLGYPSTAPDIVQRLRDLADGASGVVLVAESGDGRATGVAQALPQQFITDEPFVELAVLVVDETARDKGVGAALLAAVEHWARERGFGSVHVRSNVIRTPAHRFYLREGYAERKRQAVFVKRL